MIYAQNTWYVQTTGQWHGVVVAATAEDAIAHVWELLDSRVGGRAGSQIRGVEQKDTVFLSVEAS